MTETLSRQSILDQTAQHVRELLSGDSSGHDWWHIERVRAAALAIGQREGADLFVVELAALLHDIADWKFHDGDDTLGGVVDYTVITPGETIEVTDREQRPDGWYYVQEFPLMTSVTR